ncbi:AEC family transporter [Alphaproteobacteria bacterium LSUCC0684]
MLDVLSLSIPFFALIFLGLGARAISFCDENGAKLLSRFAFFVALPPFMFINIAASNAQDILNWGFVWRYETGTIVIFLISAFIARSLFRLTRSETGIFGLNSVYPNYGYMGVPLAILAFGEAAALPMALILLADTIVLLALTSIFVSKEGQGMLDVPLQIIRTMARNPLMISVISGLAFSALGVEMPVIAHRFIMMLAGAAAPVALFALGATLYGQPIRSAMAELNTLTMIKLVIHPWLIAALFIFFPGQDILWVKVAIISSCLPVAANVFMLSHVYGAYSGRTASTIFLSTMVATLTVPVVLYLVFLL